MPSVVQRLSKARDVNSQLSIQIVRMGEFGNCALSLRICVRRQARTRFRVDIRDTWDHFVEEQIITRKKQKGPPGGSMGLHIYINVQLFEKCRDLEYCFRD